MTISRAETEALATFIQRVRPEWDRPGILAAIHKAADLGTPAAIGAAFCRLAENQALRTPALLADPGAHWAGTTVATRKPPQTCPEHPTEKAWDCRPCASQAADRETAQAKIRELHDELRKARA